MTESFLATAARIFDEPAAQPAQRTLVATGVTTAEALANPAAVFGKGYGRTAIDAECDRVIATPPNGGRNNQLNTAAFNLGQLVGGGVLDEQLVVDELTAAANLSGLDVDPGCGPAGIAATIASGIAAGKQHPRSVPDPPTPSAPSTAAVASNAAADGDEEPSLLDTLREALVDTSGLDSIPEPEPLIGDVLFGDSTAWLVGPPGNGKSFLALDMAGCVAAGDRWHGHTTSRGPVLYLVAEGLWGIRGRVRAWESAMGHPMNDVHFLPIAVQAAGPAWSAFCGLAGEISPALVVVDTQARVTVGSEENSAKDMGGFVHSIDMLRKATGACILTVHHTGKSGTMRGSTALEGAATTVIHTTKEDDLISVECAKQKDAQEFDPFELRLTSHGPSAVLSQALREAEEWRITPAIHKMLKLWWDIFGTDLVSASALEKAGIVRNTLYRNKNPLASHGYITLEGTDKAPRYRLARPPSLLRGIVP